MGRRDDEQLLRRLVAMDPRREESEPDPDPMLAAGDTRPGRDALGGRSEGDRRPRIPSAAVTGAALICVAVAVGAGGRIALGSGAPSSPVTVEGRAQPGGGRTATARPGEGEASAVRVPTTASPITGSPQGAGAVVHVVGRVRRAGLVTLTPGARVADAIAAAGGAASGADLAALNLARPVVDGEQLVVPRPGQTLAPEGASGGGSGAGTAGSAPAGGPVDLNRADAAALDALPGIGPVMAKRIIDYRSEHGPFRSVDQLAEIPGIGERTLERLTPLVRV